MSNNLFQNEGVFTPDSLIVSAKVPLITGGVKLAPKQGVLSRGSIIGKAADGLYYQSGTVIEEVTVGASGVLTDNVDTGDSSATLSVIATQYVSGLFNKNALTIKSPSTVDSFEDKLRELGIYMETVQ